MDILERLRWSISADTPARYPEIIEAAMDEIKRLRIALRSIAMHELRDWEDYEAVCDIAQEALTAPRTAEDADEKRSGDANG